MRTPASHVVEAPSTVDTIDTVDGRRLEYAEFGDDEGVPVLWLHGTPGSCRQVAPAAKAAARQRGVRIIGIARPGVGRSTRHPHRSVRAVAQELLAVPAALGIDRFAVIGLSGGGPYALGIGALANESVAGVVVMGGVAPTVGPDAADGGLQALAATFNRPLTLVARPAGCALTLALRPLTPFGSWLYDAFAGLMPEPDQRVFETPGVKDMFIDDLVRGIHDGGMHAALLDAVLFGRDWGFGLADVTVPVHWFHGDEDSLVPLDHGEHAAARLPQVTFVLQRGASHLSGYAAADEVIEAVRAFF